MPNRTQVAIVGGGPVGVALAVELGLRGIDAMLLERRTDIQRIPKGQNLTARTLEHFYFWGIVDQLRAARVMPNDYPIGGVTAYKNMMSEYWAAPPGRELVRSYYYEPNDRLPQYQMEIVLRDKLKSLPIVEARFGVTATSVRQNNNLTSVTVVDADSNESVIEADYVVGCDGGHSLVREQVGIERTGTDYDQPMLLCVFRSKELHEAFKRFPERTTYRAMDPEFKGYWMFFGRIDVGEGWFFHAPVPVGTTKDNFDFQALLDRAAGFHFGADFEYIGFWDLRVSVADRYQVGRVFIAGDAAHSHPPYGGYGLNNGLEDITNLGWKLAAVLQGWGGLKLLASYSDERRPIFWETGHDFIAAGIDSDRAFLERYSPGKNKAEFERAWEELFKKAPYSTYEPHYEGSPIVFGPLGAVCSAHGSHTFQARAGHHVPPRKLSSGAGVWSEYGQGFTLLAFGADEQSIGKFEAAASSQRVPLKIVRDTFDGGREELGSRLVLVRPDQYAVWTGDEAPLDVGAMLRKVTGNG